jgi:hypothetical protein
LIVKPNKSHPLPSVTQNNNASLSIILAGPILITAAFFAMVAYTWGGWPDILVDFGRELYIPWQLSLGQHLYADIAYYSGPLSPHLNALWFTLFGVGLKTLVIVNLVMLAGFTALLYHVLHSLSDRLTAATAILVFIAVIAFAQYATIGNYNYVTPYSHDAVHGLILGVLAVSSAMSTTKSVQLRCYAISGTTLGLCFLTRSETFVAATMGTMTLIVGGCMLQRERRAKRLAIFMVCCLTPPVLALFLLARHLPIQNALTGMLGTWPATFNAAVVAMPFFRHTMGTDELSTSLRSILAHTAAIGAILVPFVAIAVLASRPARPRIVSMLLLFTLPAVGLSLLWRDKSPEDWMRPLPLILGGLTLFWAVRTWRDRAAPQRVIGSLHRLAWCGFSLVLLGKILLRAQLFHYGFYLAAPAVLTLIVAILKWLPDALAKRGADERLFRAAILGVLAAFTVTHLGYLRQRYADKISVVNAGVDTFRSDWRAPLIIEASGAIQSVGKPTDTLVCLPEGVMLNYMMRMTNPTPHTNFMPTEMAIFGEATIFESLKAHPPDWIALIHKDTSEFGAKCFGRDYGIQFMKWIQANYVDMKLIGDRPLVDDRFGILIMHRK